MRVMTSFPLFMLEKAWQSYVRVSEQGDIYHAEKFLSYIQQWWTHYLCEQYE